MIAALLLLLPTSLHAGLRDGEFGRRISFGLEMGYIQGFFSHHRYNFLSQDGYRLHSREAGFDFTPNGYIEAFVAYSIKKNHQIAFHGGYKGVAATSRCFDLAVRYSFFYKGMAADGFFSSVKAGTGVSSRLDLDRRFICLGSLSEGYRLKLSPNVNLDFIVSLCCAFDHPEIINPEGPGYVPEQNILRNTAGYYAVSFGLALSF